MVRYESDRLCYPLRAGLAARPRIIGPTLVAAALTALVALGGCAPGKAPVINSSDAVACLSALVSAGIGGGIAAIPAVALTNPACIGLASSLVADLIAQAEVSTTSARRTMGKAP